MNHHKEDSPRGMKSSGQACPKEIRFMGAETKCDSSEQKCGLESSPLGKILRPLDCWKVPLFVKSYLRKEQQKLTKGGFPGKCLK